MCAINENGSAIQYASKELKNDKEIALLAVSQKNQSSIAFNYISEELKKIKMLF